MRPLEAETIDGRDTVASQVGDVPLEPFNHDAVCFEEELNQVGIKVADTVELVDLAQPSPLLDGEAYQLESSPQIADESEVSDKAVDDQLKEVFDMISDGPEVLETEKAELPKKSSGPAIVAESELPDDDNESEQPRMTTFQYVPTLMGEHRLTTKMNKPQAMDESEIIGEDSQALEDDDESYVEQANKSISNVDVNPSIAPSHMTFANPD